MSSGQLKRDISEVGVHVFWLPGIKFLSWVDLGSFGYLCHLMK